MYGKQNYRLLCPQHWKADPTNSESRLLPRQPAIGFLRLQRQQAGKKILIQHIGLMFLCINNLINFIVNIFPKLKYFGYFNFNIYVILYIMVLYLKIFLKRYIILIMGISLN